MSYEFDHVHLKSEDPGTTANWYVKAFNFKIIKDSVRTFGDRFIRCESSNGTIINISGARTNEQMGNGDSNAHWGLEHFGIKVTNMEEEIKRLEKLGAKLLEGPIQVPDGPLIAFIKGPIDVRIELLQYT
jgi:predicted enzyme related to lactoylglutathione lyase